MTDSPRLATPRAAGVLEVHLEKKLPGFSLDVSWSVGNEMAVLFGYSGSGKSMTLRMIAGLSRPDAGRVTLDGEVLYDGENGSWLPPQQRHLGFVGQNVALFPHMSVLKNIMYGLNDIPKQERIERAEEFIEAFHLQGMAKRSPREISGGQQQRVALARTLAPRPKALLLDEPFSALDQPLKEELWALIKEVRHKLSIPTVVVTHDPLDARTAADRIIVYQAGRVLRSGVPAKILDRPDEPELATLAEAGVTFHDVAEFGSGMEYSI
jgi:molybdate transport system ATP-binding protein